MIVDILGAIIAIILISVITVPIPLGMWMILRANK
jgi:hypothetical protein